MHRESAIEIVFKYIQLTAGAALGAASVVIFLIPADVVPSGVTGAAVLLNELLGIPVGLSNALINVPILYMGYRMLPGGWRNTVRTIYAVAAFSIIVDVMAGAFPDVAYTDDRFLNALFGGILGGVAGGIVYRTGTNFGGTSTLSLILQRRLGLPLSSTILYTDTAVIVAAGLVFGVEAALYALVVLFLGGIAADYVMEGPSVIRTVSVITEKTDEVTQAIMDRLQRGVTIIPAKGGYTRADRTMLYITISRSQVREFKALIDEVDPQAFIVIGQGHVAYGQGFKPIGKPPRQLTVAEPGRLPAD